MAGHVQDRWYKTTTGPNGKPVKVKTDRHGSGLRYRARYVGPDGTEKSQSFPDKQKRRADAWLAQVAADMTRGQYVDPAAGKVTFQQFATQWLASQTTDVSTIVAMELRFRLHVFPHIGSRSLSAFQPGHIRTWARALKDSGIASSYQRVIFANVSSAFAAAVDDGIIARNPCRAGSVKAPKLDPRKLKPWTRERVLPSGAGSLSSTPRWWTWAPDAAFGKVRSSAWPWMRSTSSAASCTLSARSRWSGRTWSSLRPRAASSGTCRCPRSCRGRWLSTSPVGLPSRSRFLERRRTDRRSPRR
jgi:hypothetical protein